MSSRLPAIRRQSRSDGERDHYNGSQGAAQLWLRITAFLSHKSDNTRTTYLGVIKEWCNFLGAEAGSARAADLFLKATDLNASAYKVWLERRRGQAPRMEGAKIPVKERALSNQRIKQRRDGLQSTQSDATIRKKFAALRRLYRMAIGADLGIRTNPFDVDRVPPPPAGRGQKRPTEMVDFSLIKRIILSPDVRTEKGLRDAALLAALFGGGLRRSEAAVLRLGDVRRTGRGTLYLRLRATKAKRDADQALPAWAAKMVDDLLRQRRRQGAGEGDYLFNSYRGKGGNVTTPFPLSPSGIYDLFKKYCRKAGVKHAVSPHSARATAITKLLTDGLNHREVQEFSRHASVQMVEAYDKRRIGIDDSAAKDLEY